MGRKRSHTPLNLFFNNRQVGQLNRDTTGAIKFSYVDSWLAWQPAFPVSISLPLRDDKFVGASVTAVFDNLLPDNALIRQRVAERVGAAGTDAFSLLTEIGRDCVGALQFLPDGLAPQPLTELTGRSLSEADVSSLINDLDRAPLGIRSENDFRISIAGAQEKTALLYHNGEWIEPSGTTPTSHIIKPQIGKLSNGMDLSTSVENEYLCLKLMEAFGLKTAQVDVAQFNHQRVLVVERFDRQWTPNGQLLRLPQEDCCQALSIPPTRKYQNEGGPGIVEIMSTLRGSDEPNKDRYDFFKTQILFWLIGATDGHAKNFSLALFSQGRFQMTPLYDVMSLQLLYDNHQIRHKDFKLAMRIGKSNQYNIENILGRHFADTAQKSGLSRDVLESIISDLSENIDTAIQTTANNLPAEFSDELLDSIAAAISHRLPRLKEL